MSDPNTLRMSAYYFGFESSSALEIDRVLSAVCDAGKGFHHTDQWSDEQDFLDGKSYVDLIQERANEAAAALLAERDINADLLAALKYWVAHAETDERYSAWLSNARDVIARAEGKTDE